MKSKLKRLAVLTMVLLLLITPLSGCSKWRYGVTAVYGKAGNDLIQEEFLMENMIRSAHYPNPEYWGEENETEDESDMRNHPYIGDPTAPETRTFVITDTETYNSIYVSEAPEVDFDKQMVVLHIFYSIYSREFLLQKIRKNNDVIMIYCKEEWHDSRRKDCCNFRARTVTIILDKADCETVEVVIVDD